MFNHRVEQYDLQPFRTWLWLIALLSGCDVHDYVPTAESLASESNPTRAFVVDAESFHGVAGNIDMVHEIYTYLTRVETPEEYWTRIDRRAAEYGWHLVATTPDFRRYEADARTEPGQHPLRSLVRVGFVQATRTAVVAWTYDQSDGSRNGRAHSEQTAAEYVWPKFMVQLKLERSKGIDQPRP